MYCDYEEPYYDPSAADMILTEYQEKMKEILLESVKSDVNSVKKENERLKQELDIYKARVREVNNKERDLERQKTEILQTVRRERLSKLMEDFEVIMYRAYSKEEKFPKCNKCDENRRIHFKSPLGKDMMESCSCDKGKTIYYPQESHCCEFKISRDNNKFDVWYDLHDEKDYDWFKYNNNSYVRTIFKDGMNYDELDKWDTYFKSKEECEKYCDWLNTKTANKNQILKEK